jgi:hypothetical protein
MTTLHWVVMVALGVWYAFAASSIILDIGEVREPYTPGTALASVGVLGAVYAAILYLGGYVAVGR